MELPANEIRDYVQRAPKRIYFNGQGMVNTMHVRLKWLCEIARGTLDERINRRAGISDPWRPWAFPIESARRRNQRNLMRKKGLGPFVRWQHAK